MATLEIGERLRHWRKAAGMTQGALATAVGVSAPTTQGTPHRVPFSLESFCHRFHILCVKTQKPDRTIRCIGLLTSGPNAFASLVARSFGHDPG